MDHSERVQGYILRHSAVKIPTDLEKKTLPQPSQKVQFPILRENTKICLSNAIILKFGEDHHNDKQNLSCKFHQNPSWGRSFPLLVVPFPLTKF